MPTRVYYQTVNASSVSIAEVNEWTLVVIKKESSGTVVVKTEDGGLVTGMSTIGDTPLTLLLAPGTALYANATTNEAIAVALTPLQGLLDALGDAIMAATCRFPGRH